MNDGKEDKEEPTKMHVNIDEALYLHWETALVWRATTLWNTISDKCSTALAYTHGKNGMWGTS